MDVTSLGGGYEGRFLFFEVCSDPLRVMPMEPDCFPTSFPLREGIMFFYASAVDRLQENTRLIKSGGM